VEAWYQPLQLLLGAGGLGLLSVGLVRLGTMIANLKAVRETAAKLEISFDEFKKDNSKSHTDIRVDISSVRERVVAVETKINSLPCNGVKPLSVCDPQGG
jgi:hypothetical protein